MHGLRIYPAALFRFTSGLDDRSHLLDEVFRIVFEEPRIDLLFEQSRPALLLRKSETYFEKSKYDTKNLKKDSPARRLTPW